MKYNLLIITILIFSISYSQKVTDEFVVQEFANITGKLSAPKNKIIIKHDLPKEYVYNFTDGGFMIIRKSQYNIEIMAFSYENEFKIKDNPLLKNFENSIEYIDLSSINYYEKPWFKSIKPVLKNSKDDVLPFLTDVWGGVNCEDANGNNVYPSNYYTPSHCSPGCVAIASSQILHYYEWPKSGVGNNVYADNYIGNLIRHEAFFDHTHYDWNNMLDEYMNVNSSTIEQQAIGELMYHMGVAVQMDYENYGSTNNLDNIPFALENFFRFSGHYEVESWSEFWNRMYDSMQLHKPVPVAIENDDNGDGHVMVANGYKYLNNKNYYYINWGWWNAYGLNGYYNMQGWVPGGSGYDTVIGAIFDMYPEPEIYDIEATGNGDDFMVKWRVSDQLNWEEFTLEQKVDGGNWETVATGITDKEYTISNPTGNVYQFRVKSKVDGYYYAESWSEVETYAVTNWFNGYAQFEGSQYAYARQTPDNDLNFQGDYTFETWIRLESNNQNGDVIIDQENVFGWTIQDMSATEYSVQFTSHSTGASLSSAQNAYKLQLDQWHHIAVSKTGNNLTIYVDGDQKASYNGTDFNLSTSNAALNIGEKYRAGYTSWIKADFDQMRISSTGRYNSNFTPTRDHQFELDSETIAYFTFQNVHRVRFKDEAYNLSVIVKNASNYITWNYEESIGSLGILENQLKNLTMLAYPNPAKDNIRFKINRIANDTEYKLSIFDTNGQSIFNSNNWTNNKSLNVSTFQSGLYFVKTTANNKTSIIKIIKY